jgi:hypothetical protein
VKPQPVVIDVFVSYPSDMEEERNKLRDVISELNRTSRRRYYLNLIDWKTHSVPAIGNHAQETINEISPESAQIFIGLMGARFGTATPSANSGTEDEFNRAVTRHNEDPDANRIMFYFRTAPPSSLDEIDLEQLAKVRDFKASLKSSGLIWDFDTLAQFEVDIRVHLLQEAQRIAESATSEGNGEAECKQSSTSEPSEDAPGYLEYLSIAEDSSGILNEIVQSIGEDTTAIGLRMRERTEELETIGKMRNSTMARSKLAALVNHAATDLTMYASSLRPKLPNVK